MGQAGSKERSLFTDIVCHMLQKRGTKISKKKVQNFLAFIQECCPWFPEEGTVNLETWSKVGEQLRTYYDLHGPEKIPKEALTLWTLFRDTLDPQHELLRLMEHCHLTAPRLSRQNSQVSEKTPLLEQTQPQAYMATQIRKNSESESHSDDDSFPHDPGGTLNPTDEADLPLQEQVKLLKMLCSI